jgi:hypothetical protein
MLRLSRLFCPVAALVPVLSACAEEPRVVPFPIFLDLSTYCASELLATESFPDVISTDLLVVDAQALARTEVDVLARGGCTSVEISGDGVEIQQRFIRAILEVMDGMPELPIGRQYGLVGGLYWDDPDCSQGGGEPRLCSMSEPFGEVPVPEGTPDGADLHLHLLCPPRSPASAAACLEASQCPSGSACRFGSSVCAQDLQCRGATCGEDAVCVEGLCQDGAEECLGRACGAGAACDGADCVDGVGACMPASCQDYVEGLQLAPLYPVGYQHCMALHRDALADQD